MGIYFTTKFTKNTKIEIMQKDTRVYKKLS